MQSDGYHLFALSLLLGCLLVYDAMAAMTARQELLSRTRQRSEFNVSLYRGRTESLQTAVHVSRAVLGKQACRAPSYQIDAMSEWLDSYRFW